MKKTAFLFPGQGAQYVGMGKDFYETYEVARRVFDLADEILGYKLSGIIFQGPIEKLTLTEYSQPAIFVVSAAILEVMKKEMPDLSPYICAGLSLGEYTALYAAGKMLFRDVLLLLQKRARLMSAACEKYKGTMSAVLGLNAETVVNAITGIEGVWAANFNCPNQVVISGTYAGIEKAESKLREMGAKRVIRIDVQGAFHSGLMQEAQQELSIAIEKTAMQPSDIQVVMNVSATVCRDEKALKQLLTRQLTNSVKWEDSIRYMQKIDVSMYLEIGPGKTLCGLNQKIGVQEYCQSLESIKDVKDFLMKTLQDVNDAQK